MSELTAVSLSLFFSRNFSKDYEARLFSLKGNETRHGTARLHPYCHFAFAMAKHYTCQLFVRYKRETFLLGVRGISEEDTIIDRKSVV